MHCEISVEEIKIIKNGYHPIIGTKVHFKFGWQCKQLVAHSVKKFSHQDFEIYKHLGEIFVVPVPGPNYYGRIWKLYTNRLFSFTNVKQFFFLVLKCKKQIRFVIYWLL